MNELLNYSRRVFHKACSQVVYVSPTNELWMDDFWICEMHKFVTINHPQLIVSELNRIKSIRYGERKKLHNSEHPEFGYETTKYSIITLEDQSKIKVGDFIYTHNIRENE